MNATKICHKVFAFCILMLSFCGAWAQTRDTTYYTKKTYYWITGEVGFGNPDFHVAAELNYLMKDNYLFTLKTGASGKIFGDPGDFIEASELGCLIGKKLTHRKKLNPYLSAGAALVKITQRGYPIARNAGETYLDDKSAVTIGLPVDLKLLYSPIPDLGLSIGAGINVNPKHAFGSINIGISLGRMRL